MILNMCASRNFREGIGATPPPPKKKNTWKKVPHKENRVAKMPPHGENALHSEKKVAEMSPI